MPQTRRKVPFSGKKKKDQLLAKRQTKGSQNYLKTSYDSNDDGDTTEDNSENVQKLNAQPTRGRNKNTNRYNLQFYEESKKELELMKEEAKLPLKFIEPIEREMNNHFFDNYDFPIRPEWSHKWSKEELDRNENRYFREYVEKLNKSHSGENKSLSLFELNLETWRQLWRVLEISDILLIIVDVRYSTLMFPPSLYKHITQNLKKHAILVLNKVDLVSPESVLAWKSYFVDTYPGLPVVIFASYPSKTVKGTANGRKTHKRCIEGVYNLLKECKKIAEPHVDLSEWEKKILEDMKDDFFFEDNQACGQEATHVEKTDFNFEEHVMYRGGILTIGCIGFPNVGKSSFINALKGKKVVSVSRTPGHTKHFQTIFLTNNVKLSDCPGLVFPSATPKYLQVLLGSYPISQLRQPYRSLKYLSERIDLCKILKLNLPSDFEEWSAEAICEAWALKRGFLTAKACRPDLNRAANHLLRMCLSGQIVLEFYPPGFIADEERWKSSPEIDEIKKFQGESEIQGSSSSGSFSGKQSDGDDSDNESSTEGSSGDDDSDSAFKPRKNKNAFALLGDD